MEEQRGRETPAAPDREGAPTVPEWWWDSDDGPEYLVLPDRGDASPPLRRREAEVQSVGARVERLEDMSTRTASQVAQMREELGRLAADLRGSLESLSATVEVLRTNGVKVVREVGDTRRELGAAVDTARAEAVAHGTAMRAELDERAGGIRASLDEIHASLTQALRDAVVQVGIGLREAGHAVEASIGEASRAMGEEHASTMDRYSKELAIALRPVADGVSRVERLGSVIEAMGRRRGFQELVRSERTLREEQSAFVRALSDAGSDVSIRVAGLAELVGRLEERLDRAGQEADALKQLPAHTTERVTAAVERLRGELSAVLEERFGEQVGQSVDRLRMELEAGLPLEEAVTRLRDLPRAQAELAKAQRSIDAMVVSLRTEVRALRDRIQSWGKPRTAPRLSQDLDAVSARLEALEGEARGAIADRVAQVVTTRVLNALREPDAGRRGLRRRS